MNHSSLRVVQITDLHVTEAEGNLLQGIDTGNSLQKVLTAINTLVPRPQLIIATGDLVEETSVASYRRLSGILSGIDIPIYVLCGNHDSADLIRQQLVGNNIHFESFVETESWALTLVNSKIEGQSHGVVTPQELDKLEQNLHKTGDKPVLVALHHPTIKSCPSAGCQLKNGDEFVSFLKVQKNVKAVMAGHTHLAAEIRDDHLIQFTSPSTFAQAIHSPDADPTGREDFLKSHKFDLSRHGYRILDLLTDGNIKSSVEWVKSDANR